MRYTSFASMARFSIINKHTLEVDFGHTKDEWDEFHVHDYGDITHTWPTYEDKNSFISIGFNGSQPIRMYYISIETKFSHQIKLLWPETTVFDEILTIFQKIVEIDNELHINGIYY